MNVKIKSRPGRLLVVPALSLLTLCLLFLTVSLVQKPAYSQGLTPTKAPESAPDAEPHAVPTPTCPYEGKTDPPPGQTARLIGDDEIQVFYRYDPSYLRNQVVNWDEANGLLAKGSTKNWSNNSKLAQGWWLNAAASDLNGDHKAELLAGFQNVDQQLGAIADPFTTVTAYDWSHSGGRFDGGSLDDVDVAAGNLDRSSDNSDEIALAFRDDEEDIHVVVLDGASNGTILNADDSKTSDAWWDHRTEERGDVHHVTVATGDLNGDGNDNEIVTAYKDSGSDLQVIVLRQQSDATLKQIYAYDSYHATPKFDTVADSGPYQENWRPIDVTTGDLDGDMQDEVIVGFRNGHFSTGVVTLLVLDVTKEDEATQILTMSNDVTKDISIKTGYEYAATSVSISAADLDGDGYDEIAVGYNRTYNSGSSDEWYWQQFLLTYNYARYNSTEWQQHCGTAKTSCLFQRPGTWHSAAYYFDNDLVDDNRGEARISVATGDLDQDGMAEIALARTQAAWPDKADPNNDLEVYAFDADPGVANGLAAKPGSPVKFDPGSGHIGEFALAMGDLDGDSVWGEYNGHCAYREEAVVQAVLHAPPYWPEGHGLSGCDNAYGTQAGYGKNVAQGGGSGETAETTVSGYVSLGADVKGIKPSFSTSWEHTSFAETTVLTKTTEGDSAATNPPVNIQNDPDVSYETVVIYQPAYWCYEYTVPEAPELGVVPVCLPKWDSSSKDAKKIHWWYQYGPSTFPDSWVPVGINLAEDRKSSQSSDWNQENPPGVAYAWRAVDGDTNGDFYDGSVSHTKNDQYAWWQVDLGGLQWIDAVQIWNRTDSEYSQDRLKNFYVFVTEKDDFPTSAPGVYKPPSDLLSDADVRHYPESGPFAGPVAQKVLIPVNAYGRVVRVQLDHQDFLNIAEVQVYGMPGTPDQWPKKAPQGTLASGDSFTLTWRDERETDKEREQQVKGTLYHVWKSDLRQTGPGSAGLGFDLGATGSQDYVTGIGDSEKYSAGMEVKVPGAGGSWGTSYKQSNITTWESSVEFSGQPYGFGTYAPLDLLYKWAPYVWLQKATPAGGGTQQFLVLDYWVDTANTIPDPKPEPDLCPPTMPGSEPLPQAPLIESPTHPDPATWYNSNTATFTWAQPCGDPATVDTYHWYLDRDPDTVPIGHHLGLTTSATYDGLGDGTWYLHVRPMSDGEEWGATGHRMIRVDAKPPQVSLALDPPLPTGNGDWYVTPVTVSVSATEPIGSGVTGVEVSTDGVTWQPYTAPLMFTADTPGTTVYARASDAVGNISEPVSNTVKIDRTPPDSHVAGGAGPGTWVAEVRTDPAGNDVLVLAGSIADNISGRAGMVLENEGMYWGAAAEIGTWRPLPNPTIEVNWYYTSTNQLGAGYHIFTGRAQDEAGNREDAYEIGRVLWLPKATPDLGGSSVTASQKTARPSDMLLFTLVARNGGFQEAHVAVADTLPEGLTPILEALPEGADYDAATRTLTWPTRLLWPGQWERRSFLARVDAGLGATILENQASFHAFWPNTDLLTDPTERQAFEQREQTVIATATVAIDPKLPAGADVIAPWVIFVPPAKQAVDGAVVELDIRAEPDAQRMYLREWTPDPTTGAWIVAQNSGWIDYSQAYTWTLSSGQGLKYLGVWLADEAGNVSTLNEQSQVFVNRMDGNQILADGQRVQYRGLLRGDEFVSGVLKTVSGDPDVYLWKPRNAFWPDRYANDTVLPGQVETFSNQFAPEAGRYLLEVQAVGDSEYELSLTGEGGELAAASYAALEKARPPHPLTVSDPLSAGQLGPEVSPYVRRHLPLVMRDH